MRRYSRAIVVLCATALLAMQAAGLHLHANPDTDGVQMHAEHVHSLDPDGHDHSADVDVTIVELGMVWAKLVPLPLATGLYLPAPFLLRWRSDVPRHSPAPSGNANRWRPPLRAPPLTA